MKTAISVEAIVEALKFDGLWANPASIKVVKVTSGARCAMCHVVLGGRALVFNTGAPGSRLVPVCCDRLACRGRQRLEEAVSCDIEVGPNNRIIGQAEIDALYSLDAVQL